MSNLSRNTGLTEVELRGRNEWLRLALRAAEDEGRYISTEERLVMERYARGEIMGEEARDLILRLHETPTSS
jgi:hypothetical protein